MRTALPAPAFLADMTTRRQRERLDRLARAVELGLMGLARELGVKCGEALDQLAACTPRMRRLYQAKPEHRAELRMRWRRAHHEALTRWLGPVKAIVEQALARGERVAVIGHGPSGFGVEPIPTGEV